MTSIADMSSHAIDMAPRVNAGVAIDWLRLAAAPTFATMALLTGIGGGQMPMICGADASFLTGMVPMYALMSIFHTPAWLKLIANRRIVHHNKRKG